MYEEGEDLLKIRNHIDEKYGANGVPSTPTPMPEASKKNSDL